MCDFVGESLVGAFAALQGHGTVAEFVRQFRAFNHFLIAELVAREVRVLAAHAAIEARLGANVTVFNQSAQVHIVVQVRQFGLQSLVEQQFLVVALGG